MTRRCCLLTLNSDGNLLMSLQSQFGLIPGDSFQSMMHGTWKLTGDGQIDATTFFLTFGENGIPPNAFGADVGRYRWEWTLDGDDALSGRTVEHSAWTPPQDPLDDPPALEPPPLTITARRTN